MSIRSAEPAPPASDDAASDSVMSGEAMASAGPGQERLTVPARRHSDTVSVVSADLQLLARIKAIWRSRELLILFVRTDLKVKYKSSVLGYLWSMLNPALVLAIYYLIFKVISRSPIPMFAIWLFAGLLVWNLFNVAAMSATGVVVGRAGIVKKVAFPRELLALSQVGVASFLFLIQLVVMVISLVAFGISPAYQYLPLVPLALVVLLIFTGALSIFLSAVNVYLRDTQHLTEVLLMAWFWLTPIVYSYGQVSKQLKAHHLTALYLLNPITPIAMTFQRAIYGRTSYVTGGVTEPLLPHVGIGTYALGLVAELVVVSVLFILALVVFGKLEGNFAEEL
ncbi:MAG TPA: ABC transporter permease [Acidimicrobiales bacterium]